MAVYGSDVERRQPRETRDTHDGTQFLEMRRLLEVPCAPFEGAQGQVQEARDDDPAQKPRVDPRCGCIPFVAAARELTTGIRRQGRQRGETGSVCLALVKFQACAQTSGRLVSYYYLFCHNANIMRRMNLAQYPFRRVARHRSLPFFPSTQGKNPLVFFPPARKAAIFFSLPFSVLGGFFGGFTLKIFWKEGGFFVEVVF